MKRTAFLTLKPFQFGYIPVYNVSLCLNQTVCNNTIWLFGGIERAWNLNGKNKKKCLRMLGEQLIVVENSSLKRPWLKESNALNI